MSALKSISAFLAAAAVTGSVGVGYAQGVKGSNQDLPDLGSPANAAISIDDEYHAGLSYVNEIRNTGLILTDPEVRQYAQEIGHSLSSHAEEGQHQFYYFVLRDPVVNAFAVPGGFVAIQSGLILATRNENELAGVLAHETRHVAQRDILRQIICQGHDGVLARGALLRVVLWWPAARGPSPQRLAEAPL